METETIEERAINYAYEEWTSEFTDIAKESYETGAKEQKAIDNDKAKNAFNKVCGWLSTYPWFNEVAEEFIKTIEE